MNNDDSFPTILVAGDREILSTLVRRLRQDGYLVLEAKNCDEALQLLIGQARRIHILLADSDMEGEKLALTLQGYRPNMTALFVKADVEEGVSCALKPGMALAKVREALPLPEEISAGATKRNIAACA